MRHYPQGQTIHLFASFSADGAPLEPEGLHVVTDLDGVETNYAYDPGPIVRLGDGSFALDILPDGPGTLTYRWAATGVASPDIRIRVLETVFGA